MTRLGSLILVIALAGAIGWTARKHASSTDEAAAVEVNARWVDVHYPQLRRILNLPASMELEFKEVEKSETPGYQLVVFDLVDGERRREFELHVSQDGRRVLYDRLYPVENPFEELRRQIRLEGAPARGPADAPVTIVEYSDYTCGYCRQFFRTIEEPLFARYGDRIRFVYKNFPLTGLRSWSKEAAIAAACAYRQGNDRFWALHDKLFQAASQLREGEPVLVRLARETGLDVPAFRQCLEQQEGLIDVARDIEEGERLGVEGTPTFFINGRPVPGLVPPAFFFQIVEEELAAAQRRLAQSSR